MSDVTREVHDVADVPDVPGEVPNVAVDVSDLYSVAGDVHDV